MLKPNKAENIARQRHDDMTVQEFQVEPKKLYTISTRFHVPYSKSMNEVWRNFI